MHACRPVKHQKPLQFSVLLFFAIAIFSSFQRKHEQAIIAIIILY
jgi:hypothetical protein